MNRPGRLTRAALAAPAHLFDLGGGRLLGHRFLRLTHRGRVSGREYRTVLEVVGQLERSGEYVVMSGLGPGSDWFRNIQAGSAERVEIGGLRLVKPGHRVLPPDEAAEVFAAYERRNRAFAPAMRFVLSRLLGWRYDGGPQARARLTAQLPFVAFRPSPADAGPRQS